jgi:hypothetical protein
MEIVSLKCCYAGSNGSVYSNMIEWCFYFSFLCFPQISNFLDLSITEETWVIKMCTWCIKIGNISDLRCNPWVEASAGGLLAPKGLYSPATKYFGSYFEIQIWIELSRESKFCKLIWKQRIIFLRHSFILQRIWLNFKALFGFHPTALSVFFFFLQIFIFLFTWASLKRLV